MPTSNSILWSTLLLEFSRHDFERFYRAGTINNWELSFILNLHTLVSDNRRYSPSERQRVKLRQVLSKIAPNRPIYFDTQSYDILSSSLSSGSVLSFDNDVAPISPVRRRDPNDVPVFMPVSGPISPPDSIMSADEVRRVITGGFQVSEPELSPDEVSILDVFDALSTSARILSRHNTDNIQFGIEIETAGISRESMARAVATIFNTTHRYEGGTYDTHTVTIEGKTWSFKSDASITEVNGVYKGCEIVSPPLHLKDFPVLKKIIRCAKANRAKPHKSCGIHVHIDGANFRSEEIFFLVKNYIAIEDALYKFLGIAAPSRLDRFTKKLPESFKRKFRNETYSADRFNIAKLKEIWYDTLGSSVRGSSSHYDSSRYHGLNLHSYFYRGTIEFRLFNASLNCSKIQAYVLLCLFIAANALNKDITYPAVRSSDVSVEFMNSTFKDIIGLPYREWVSPEASSLLLANYGSLTYRLEGRDDSSDI